MNKIYVGNLSFNVTKQELEELFGQYGKITEIALIRDRYSNQLKGFGFITFDSSESAKKSIDMDGKEFLGRPLKVSLAKERRDSRDGGNGGNGGRRGGGDRW